MKIDPISSKNYIQSYKSSRVSVPNKNSGKGATDEVSFSSGAISFSKTLSAAKEQIQTRTTSEQTRLNEVSDLVKKGQYNISSEDVAESILKTFGII